MGILEAEELMLCNANPRQLATALSIAPLATYQAPYSLLDRDVEWQVAPLSPATRRRVRRLPAAGLGDARWSGCCGGLRGTCRRRQAVSRSTTAGGTRHDALMVSLVLRSPECQEGHSSPA
jgi:aryl-alcohol dehydrogenase-like predicted oxidoreductase